MSKKLYAAFLPLLAVTAFTAMPAVAQAAPHWYSCAKQTGGKFKNSTCTEAASPGTFEWAKVAENTPVTIKTEGTITLLHAGAILSCSVKGKGTIENPAGGGAGMDSITEFKNSECTSNEIETCSELTIIVLHDGKVLSVKNALPSTLIAQEKLRDEISGFELEIKCDGLVAELLKGSPKPEIGDSAFGFGPGSGELEDSQGDKWGINGHLDLEGPAGNKGITAKNP